MHTYTLAANQTRTHFSLEREVEEITFFFSISALINKQEKQTYVCTELVLNYPIHTRLREEKQKKKEKPLTERNHTQAMFFFLFRSHPPLEIHLTTSCRVFVCAAHVRVNIYGWQW